jgi:hypothetical protein
VASQSRGLALATPMVAVPSQADITGTTQALVVMIVQLSMRLSLEELIGRRTRGALFLQCTSQAGDLVIQQRNAIGELFDR